MLPLVSSVEERCYADVKINLELISKIRETETDSFLQFNQFRTTDILWIDKLDIFNEGKCTIENNTRFFLQIKPQEGYNKQNPTYGDFYFYLPNIKPNETLSLVRDYQNEYHYEIDNKDITFSTQYHGIDLDQIGEWTIKHEFVDFNNRILPKATRIIINEGDIEWFTVITKDKASMQEQSKKSMVLDILNTKTNYYMLVFVAITLLITYAAWTSGTKQHKELKEINKNLKKILLKISYKPKHKIKSSSIKLKKRRIKRK